MITAISILVNAIAPVMNAQGTLLAGNSVPMVTGNAALDIFNVLGAPWIGAAGDIEIALAQVMHSLVKVLEALAT